MILYSDRLNMKGSIISLFLLCICSILFSQENTYSPFPSRIKTYQNNLEIILTWNDSPDLSDEDYAIYRSNSPVTEEYIKTNDPIAVIPAGMGIYTDKPESSGQFYYGIICITAQREYPICLPYRNCTDKAVVLEDETYQKQWANKISELKLTLVDDQIALSFKGENQDRSMAIFRATFPVNVSSAVEEARLIRILEPGQSYYLDSPIAGIPYYYAVVDYQLYSSGDQEVVYEGNYSKKSITLPISRYSGSDFLNSIPRRAPLPNIKLEQFFKEVQEANLFLPPEQTLSEKLEGRINQLGRSEAERNRKTYPQVLAYEMSESNLPIQNRLITIVLQDMEKDNNWDEASQELLYLLKDTDDLNMQARILFYHGQCNYFLQRWEEAYLDLALSFTHYPKDSRSWMESILLEL